jgi:Tol biopolymer transport system component
MAASVAGGMGWWLARANIPPAIVSRLSISLPVPLSTHYETANIALSPDGATLAYVGAMNGTSRLYVRTMDQIEIKPLAGTEGAIGPVFSPDGAWIGFVADRKLKKVPVLGGSPTVMNEGNPDAFSSNWTPDGSIVFTRGFTLGLARVSASGGDAQTLMTPEPSKGESSYIWPRVMPGGADLLFVINLEGNASFNEGRIAVETLGKKDSREILDAQGSFPIYTESGHLVFFSSGSVRAAPFDLRQRKMTGPAVPVVEGVSVAPHTGAVQAAISRSGTLAYAAVGDQVPKTSLVIVDLNGRAQPLTEALPNLLGEMSVSSDGQRVALRSAKANDDIHVFDIPRGSLTRFTYEGGDEQNPVWTPDGKRLAYASQRGGTPAMYWKQADGNGTPEQILAPPYPHRPSSFSPDGKLLAYTEVHPQRGLDIWTVRLDERRHASRSRFCKRVLTRICRSFRPMAAGSPIGRTNRAGWRSTSLSFRERPSSDRSRLMAGISRNGHPTETVVLHERESHHERGPDQRIRTAFHQAAIALRKNVFFILGRQRHLGTYLGGVSRGQEVPVRRQSHAA